MVPIVIVFTISFWCTMVADEKKISGPTIMRLPIYGQALTNLQEKGIETVSSRLLGEMVGSTAAQVRKDLSCFGEFGKPGTGYRAGLLKDAIFRILGTDHALNTALVGVGRLGSALLAYPGFGNHGLKIVAAFDNDIIKIGKKWEDVIIEDISQLGAAVERKRIKIAILAVPGEIAQEVAGKVVSSGIRAILNFAPARISVPEGVQLRNVDLSSELESLAYFLTHGTGSGKGPGSREP